MIEWNDEQLDAAGIDRKKLTSLVRRFGQLSREMRAMGISVFGCSGSGCLIHKSCSVGDHGHSAVVADIGPGFDGGDF